MVSWSHWKWQQALRGSFLPTFLRARCLNRKLSLIVYISIVFPILGFVVDHEMSQMRHCLLGIVIVALICKWKQTRL